MQDHNNTSTVNAIIGDINNPNKSKELIKTKLNLLLELLYLVLFVRVGREYKINEISRVK